MYLVRTQPGGEGGSGHSYKLYYCTGGRGGQKRPKTCVHTMYTVPNLKLHDITSLYAEESCNMNNVCNYKVMTHRFLFHGKQFWCEITMFTIKTLPQLGLANLKLCQDFYT